MCILKWFTEKEQNLRFVCASAYLPVTNDANSVKALDKVIKDYSIEINDKAYECLVNVRIILILIYYIHKEFQ